MIPAVKAQLPDGRWHFQHGPIDLIISADGNPQACAAAVGECWTAFPEILPDLVTELSSLRAPMAVSSACRGPVARRMQAACRFFADCRFITPMAAVAGAVADHLISCFDRPGVVRACINNGGDIAFHLRPGESYRAGVVTDISRIDPRRISGVEVDGTIELTESSPVRGIATSGWRGRSFSLGIADSVTVLAKCAAAADAAATLIANAVNLQHEFVKRVPARTLDPQSDLGTRLVTVAVPELPRELAMEALDAGRREAVHWQRKGFLEFAMLTLQGHHAFVSSTPALAQALSFTYNTGSSPCSQFAVS
jgi:uncharacterized protein